MFGRSPSICLTRILAATLIVATSGAPSVGRSQQVAGSIGVSLTILQSIASQSIRVTSFSVDRNGVARLETTVPASARTSQLVMTRISSSSTGVASEVQPSALVPPSSTELRLGYLVHLGRVPRNARARRVELRVEYLTVAGT
jgi:hypothetical protein